MQWNLVEDLNDLRPEMGRVFSPPLAALVPTGGDDHPLELPQGLPPQTAYSFQEQYTPDFAGTRTEDIALTIDIKPPFPLDPAHPELPPPAFRFHAMARGRVSVIPAAGTRPAALLLRTEAFGVLGAGSVPWTQRWVEAGAIPYEIVYENVDLDHFRDYLLAIPLTGAHGLKFPRSTTAPIDTNAARTDFVTTFLTSPKDALGQPTHFVLVEPGAFMGHAAAKPGATDGSRRVIMHVHYSDHAPGAEQPMNPRELFYLLFGDQSLYAQDHPLLQQLDERPMGRPFTTKDMVLRPPLRTSARIFWEAEQEQAFEDDLVAQGRPRRWTAAAQFPAAALFDTFSRQVPPNGPTQTVGYQNNGLANVNKCNVFTSDICVRAGFRTMILDSQGRWHYQYANSHTHAARAVIRAAAPARPARLQINGQGVADAGRRWGWALTRFLTAGTPLATMNAMVDTEGRALLLCGARPRKLGNGHQVAACVIGNLAAGSGHMAFVRSFVRPPTLQQNNDVEAPGLPANAQTLARQEIISAQAGTTVGAVANRRFDPHFGGVAANAGADFEFIRIHLLEVSPGRDPDTLQGLFDLHVIRLDANTLQTALDRATTVPIANTQPQQCCADQFPNQNNVTVVNC